MLVDMCVANRRVQGYKFNRVALSTLWKCKMEQLMIDNTADRPTIQI